MKKAVIIIPTYNEAYDIEKIVESVFSITSKINNWQFTVLVIDSTSPDGTSQIVEGLKKKHKNLVLIKTKKEGLGKAYMTGFTYALEKLEADLLFEMDADFSHDPSVLPEFVRKIDEGADFVIGSRYRKGGSIPADWGMNRKIYSVLGNLIIRLGFMKLKISDWTSGYRAIRSWVIKSSLSYIQNSTGYVFQVALLEKAVKLHARVEEIPINFVDRKYGVSKLNSGQYIKNTLLYVLTHSSFIKYVLVGGSGFIIDFGLSYLMIERVHTQFPVWLATIMSAEVAIIWNFIWNNYWTFSHKKVGHKSHEFLTSLGKFNIVALGSILIQAGLIELCVRSFGRSFWYIYKIAILGFIIIPYSYVLYNRVIWKGGRQEEKN